MRTSFTLGVVLALFVSGCSRAPDPRYEEYSDGTLTIANASSFVLVEIRLTPVRSTNWGPNLIPDALFPGEQITVRVACDYWDAVIVDEFGRECILPAIDVCYADQVWAIDNRTLRSCGF